MNADQFTVRYEAAYPKLSVIAKAIALRPSDADDLLQASIVIALQKSVAIETDADFCRWMSAILRNVAANYRRKIFRHKELTSQFDFGSLKSEFRFGANEIDFNRQTQSLEGLQDAFDDQLLMALGELAEVNRICLLLRCVLDLSYKEISELLGIPEGTVASNVSRAKEMLRSILSQSTGTGE
ncbi:MAG: RNA polymerase sigma factor [Planctomycetota bacterium]